MNSVDSHKINKHISDLDKKEEIDILEYSICVRVLVNSCSMTPKTEGKVENFLKRG